MAEAQQTKTCRKRRTSKDRMTAERTTAKNKARRQKRHVNKQVKHHLHLERWARRNGVRQMGLLDLSGKQIRRLVWLVRNDAVYAAEQA